MIYGISNVGNDEFIALILSEIGSDLKGTDDGNLHLEGIIKENDLSKGVDIQSIIVLVEQEVEIFAPDVLDAIGNGTLTVALGLISTAVYDLLKAAIRKFKKLKEYSPKKVIEIEIKDKDEHEITVKITLEDILNR